MFSTRMRIALIIGLMLLLWPQPEAHAQAPADQEGSVLVQLNGSPTDEEAAAQLAALGLVPLRRIPHIDVWVVTPAAEEIALGALAHSDAVAFAEENGPVTAFAEPDDTLYGQQWPLPVIDAPAAWDLAQGMGAPIAIVDTGIDLDHGDLQSKLWDNPGEIPGNDLDDDGNGYIDDVYGYDICNQDATPQDDNGHGSHVAGIAAAVTNDAYGVAGLAWDTPVMAVKVLRSNNSGLWADLAEGIVYAAANGAAIINLSLGYSDTSDTVALAIDYALAQGCLIIAAAGNSGSVVFFPANLPGVVAVAATDSADEVWSGSNPGPEVDLAAPGVNVLSCDDEGGWKQLTGTSMAAPHVAGLAALLWGLRPDLTREDILNIMQVTAVDVDVEGRDEKSGAGRIDAGAAVGAANRWYWQYLAVVAAN